MKPTCHLNWELKGAVHVPGQMALLPARSTRQRGEFRNTWSLPHLLPAKGKGDVPPLGGERERRLPICPPPHTLTHTHTRVHTYTHSVTHMHARTHTHTRTHTLMPQLQALPIGLQTLGIPQGERWARGGSGGRDRVTRPGDGDRGYPVQR